MKQVLTIAYTLQKRLLLLLKKRLSRLLYFWKFVSRFFSGSKKLVVYFGLYESSLDFQRLWEVHLFFYILVVSLIYQSINLSCKITVQNAGCVFAYFCGGHKNNSRLQFRSSFNLHFSNFATKHCCESIPFLKPHWYIENTWSKNKDI